MKKRVSVLCAELALCVLVTLSSCKRAVDWAKSNFNQSDSVVVPTARIKPYLQTIAIHNYFSTRGIFDALWLSDEVRSMYADMVMIRCGKNTQQGQQLLRRQLEENKHFITFYLLSEYDVPLGDSSDWHVFLKVGQHTYQPCELKAIDLVPEYRALFGKRWSKLKMAYIAKFDAHDENDQPILSASNSLMELCFHSTSKQAALAWSTSNGTTQGSV